jgi:hypothetical protein
MGRSGIRKRKRGNDVIADLHDQAEWSSYTQDIPRLGDDRREGIRLSRYARAARAAGRGDGLGDYQWTAILTTIGLAAVVAGGIWIVVLLFRWLT